MAEIVIRLDLRVGEGLRKSGRLLLAGAMLFSVAPELASESVTLTTYYPAPSGIYTTMITTANTYLARDAAGNGGKVGIGTTGPAFLLDVASTGNTWASRATSAGTGTAAVYMAHGGGYGMYVDAGNAANSGTYAMDINKNGTPYVYVRGDGWVGINTSNPQQPFDVNSYARISSVNGEGGTIQLAGNNGVGIYLENINGDFRILNNPWNAELFRVGQSGSEYNLAGSGSANSYVSAAALNTNCYWSSYGQSAATAVCGGGYYATMVTGFMSKYVMLNDGENGSGDVWCCECPTIAGWPWGVANGCPNM